MTHSPWFWNRIAKRYARQPVADEASYEHKLERTQSYLGKDMSVLEFGCGTGTTAIKHAPFVNSVRAIDISANMIAIAREKAAKDNVENVQFDVCDIIDLVAAEDRFDVVMAMSILHLLDDREAVIGQVFDLLKPGGLFISSTICLGEMKGPVKLFAALFKVLPFMPDLRLFSRTDLLASIQKAGFEIVEDWRPADDKALFVVARKKEQGLS